MPAEEPFVEGRVVSLQRYRPLDENLPGMHVKESPADECGIIFGIMPETVLARRTADDGLVKIDVEQLRVGQLVKIWGGGVEETCPGQSVATGVEVQAQPGP